MIQEGQDKEQNREGRARKKGKGRSEKEERENCKDVKVMKGKWNSV